jgi:hypothetical protein
MFDALASESGKDDRVKDFMKNGNIFIRLYSKLPLLDEEGGGGSYKAEYGNPSRPPLNLRGGDRRRQNEATSLHA